MRENINYPGVTQRSWQRIGMCEENLWTWPYTSLGVERPKEECISQDTGPVVLTQIKPHQMT